MWTGRQDGASSAVVMSKDDLDQLCLAYKKAVAEGPKVGEQVVRCPLRVQSDQSCRCWPPLKFGLCARVGQMVAGDKEEHPGESASFQSAGKPDNRGLFD